MFVDCNTSLRYSMETLDKELCDTIHINMFLTDVNKDLLTLKTY